MNYIAYVGASIVVIAAMIDIFVFDGVTEKVKPAMYYLGATLFMAGILI